MLLGLHCNHYYHFISVRIAPGTLCTDQYLQEIEYEAQCKQAAKQLGLQWKGTVDGDNDFPGCFRTEDGGNLVSFNTNRNAGRIELSSKYAGICNLGPGKMNNTEEVLIKNFKSINLNCFKELLIFYFITIS